MSLCEVPMMNFGDYSFFPYQDFGSDLVADDWESICEDEDYRPSPAAAALEAGEHVSEEALAVLDRILCVRPFCPGLAVYHYLSI